MKQESATFQLRNYSFPKFSFNTELINTSDDRSISFSVSGKYDNKTGLYELFFATEIFSGSDAFCRVQCVAAYTFSTPTSLEEIPDYFFSNSIAIVYPYVRAFVSMISTQSNNTGIILPVFNVSKLGEELKNSTIVYDSADTFIPSC